MTANTGSHPSPRDSMPGSSGGSTQSPPPQPAPPGPAGPSAPGGRVAGGAAAATPGWPDVLRASVFTLALIAVAGGIGLLRPPQTRRPSLSRLSIGRAAGW